MGKQDKRTKKFLKTKFDATIKKRRDHQKKKAVIERAEANKKAKALRSGKKTKKPTSDELESESDDEEHDVAAQMGGSDDEAGPSKAGSFKGMSVDDFLGGGYKKGMPGADEADGSDDDDDGEEDDDADSLGEIEEMSDDESGHVQDLAKLKEKDPEFYKYLQENDETLLKFGENEDDEEEGDEMDEDDDAASEKGKGKQKGGDTGPQRVTMKMLREWQRDMLKHRSIKALRKLLLAFRCAVRIGEKATNQDDDAPFVVDDSKVFNKVVLTTLKYTPVVLHHHAAVKTTNAGKFKLPLNSKKWASVKKPLQSYFSSLFTLLRTLPEQKMLYVVVSESARMVPYAPYNKKTTKEYVRRMLDLWSSAEDSVRMAAFLSLRRLAAGGDDDILEQCLRGVYSSFVKSTKQTSTHTMPNINLMKNSASELYALDPEASYRQAFGFIRQLAIHLRNCIKTKTKDSFKAVLNWQYVHCIDFWSQVLSASCDGEAVAKRGASALQPLIYPLVQVATGVVGLVPISRYFPYRLHLLHSLQRIITRTGTYVPILPSILGIFDSPEFHRKPKGSTLPPMDFETSIRAPTNYLRTRVYADQVAEETCFLLTEFLASQSRSIAFPEMTIPATVQIKRGLKTYTNPKLVAALKNLLDKVAQNSVWIQKRRDQVEFAPNDSAALEKFANDLNGDGAAKETPLEVALRLAKKVRDQKKKLLAQHELVVDDGESGSDNDHDEDDQDEKMDEDDDDE
ncbi:Nucleolar Complex 2 protein [Thecaphora frezii]